MEEEDIAVATGGCASVRQSHASPAGTAGRGLFAAQDAAAGDTILSEHAFTACLGPFGCWECVCHTCRAREVDDGPELLPCAKCRWAHWCSQACRDADVWHDSVECAAMEALRFRELDAPARVPLTARLLRRIQRRQDAGIPAAQARLAATLVGSSSDFDVRDPGEAHLVLSLAGLQPGQEAQAQQALAQVQRNDFRMLDERGVVIGSAVFPACARMNHSCKPNVTVSTSEDGAGWMLRVEALRDIRAGEELLFSYIAESGDCRTLQKQYLFTCACGSDACCCK
jgi:hypothetical protein